MPAPGNSFAETFDTGDLVAAAVAGARAGADVLRHYFRHEELEIRAKGAHDLVSRADHESEARVIEEIRRRFPEHHVLAEERGIDSGGSSDFEWLIDPLDGTANFIQGLPVFCVSVACRHGDEIVAAAILDPIGDQLFTAAKGAGAFRNGEKISVSPLPGLAGAFLATGYPFRARAALELYLDVFHDVFLEARAIRRCGSAALDLAYTAAGVYDGFFELRLSPWDIAAGVLLVSEAGGRVTDLDHGEGFFHSGNVIAGPATLQAELLDVVRRHLDETRLDAVDPIDPARAAAPASARNKLQEEFVG